MSRDVEAGPEMERTAALSGCGKYRYELTRRWGSGDAVSFVMLNPSTADADKDDATIRKCIGFAERWGYSALRVYNIFALRSTEPAALYDDGVDPVGPENWDWLRGITTREIVAAWGAHGKLRDQGRMVAEILPGGVVALYVNSDGTPKHPLYVKYNAVRKPYAAGATS